MDKVEIDNKKMWEQLLATCIRVGSEFSETLHNDLMGELKLQGLTISSDDKIVSIEPEPLKIEVGKNYRCIKDVYMSDSDRLVYLTGKIYKSECECCITDEDGKIHAWDKPSASEYFRPATPEEVLEAKHGITGISTKKAEGKLGEMIKEKTATEEEIPHEPKFKVGDWVVSDKNSVVQIKSINSNYYVLENTMRFTIDYVDKCWHIWTIQDAKDGDVLYDGVDAFIFRKTMQDDDGIMCCDTYCGIDCNNNFVINEPNECWCFAYHLTPATKQQREFLFSKMKEAGYQWDAEQKKLKVSSEPTEKAIKELDEDIAKETQPNQELTEFQGAVYTQLVSVYDGDFNPKDPTAGSYLDLICKHLLYIARKQIASDINIEDLVEEKKDSLNLERDAYFAFGAYRQGIEDTLKKIKQ